ncbi:MAG: hypothetical protein JWO66_2876 [Candidatus Eremiobacteraeota bacterium]|nr:hypothetical protein [Candidatus Eremiobacteraeota bacterium]
MRFVGTMLIPAVVTGAFVAGHVTGAQRSQIAFAQPAPQTFSHFKCYQTAVRLQKPANVVLRDQFGDSKMSLTAADLFCAPVKKKLVGANPIPLPGPGDHLLCYRGEAPAVNQVRPIVNQLQRTEIKITSPRYLCVPTWKKG